MIGRMLQILRKYASDEQLLCSLIFDEMDITAVGRSETRRLRCIRDRVGR